MRTMGAMSALEQWQMQQCLSKRSRTAWWPWSLWGSAACRLFTACAVVLLGLCLLLPQWQPGRWSVLDFQDKHEALFAIQRMLDSYHGRPAHLLQSYECAHAPALSHAGHPCMPCCTCMPGCNSGAN